MCANIAKFCYPILKIGITLCLMAIVASCRDYDNVLNRDNELYWSLWNISEISFIDNCASDVNVAYSLYTTDDYIFVAYYDKNHYLTVARRDNSGTWDYEKFPEIIDYDNHKSITMIIDANGHIHLCANMHASPLVYYRSQSPYDIHSLLKHSMIGIDENACTYPTFLLENDRLIFHYRDGGSGNGNEIFNIYNYSTKNWERLLDKPLFDGEGLCNAYIVGPKMTSDGIYHIIWCWRDTPDCSTCHGLYYAYSNDLTTWHSINGTASRIPITPSQDEFLIDDIPTKGGLINIGYQLGFNPDNKPVIAYHKYDGNDCTNIYIASANERVWDITKVTNWRWKWDFCGYGAIVPELYISDVFNRNNCTYCVYTRDGGSSYNILSYVEYGTIMTDNYKYWPNELDIMENDNEFMVKNIIFDYGHTRDNMRNKYLIRYETAKINRDSQFDVTIPSARLLLYSIRR